MFSDYQCEQFLLSPSKFVTIYQNYYVLEFMPFDLAWNSTTDVFDQIPHSCHFVLHIAVNTNPSETFVFTVIWRTKWHECGIWSKTSVEEFQGMNSSSNFGKLQQILMVITKIAHTGDQKTLFIYWKLFGVRCT